MAIKKKASKEEYMIVSEDDCQTVYTIKDAREEAYRQIKLMKNQDFEEIEVKIYKLFDHATLKVDFLQEMKS